MNILNAIWIFLGGESFFKKFWASSFYRSSLIHSGLFSSFVGAGLQSYCKSMNGPFWGFCWIPWLFTGPFHFNWLECENLPFVKSLVVVSLQVPGGWISQLESWSLGLCMYGITVSLGFREAPEIPRTLNGWFPSFGFVPASSSGLTLPEFGSLDPLIQRGCSILGGSSSLCQNQKIPPGKETWGYLSIGEHLSHRLRSYDTCRSISPTDVFSICVVFYLFMVWGLTQYQLYLRPRKSKNFSLYLTHF